MAGAKWSDEMEGIGDLNQAEFMNKIENMTRALHDGTGLSTPEQEPLLVTEQAKSTERLDGPGTLLPTREARPIQFEPEKSPSTSPSASETQKDKRPVSSAIFSKHANSQLLTVEGLSKSELSQQVGKLSSRLERALEENHSLSVAHSSAMRRIETLESQILSVQSESKSLSGRVSEWDAELADVVREAVDIVRGSKAEPSSGFIDNAEKVETEARKSVSKHEKLAKAPLKKPATTKKSGKVRKIGL